MSQPPGYPDHIHVAVTQEDLELLCHALRVFMLTCQDHIGQPEEWTEKVEDWMQRYPEFREGDTERVRDGTVLSALYTDARTLLRTMEESMLPEEGVT